MVATSPPTMPVRYAIPARRLPALVEKYGGPCRGVGPSVPVEGGGRGYRMVACGDLSTLQTILTVNPYTGRVTVDIRAIR